MSVAGVAPSSIQGIVISHEHSDHVGGLFVLARKLGVPVFMTAGTHHAWWRYARVKYEGERLEALETFSSGHGFCVGDIEVMPFTIPHDAADPVGFAFKAEGVKVGIVTDLGYMPENVKYHVQGCHVLMMESNHDLEMLRTGPYPWAVKQRVLSKNGHLSNDDLAKFLCSDYDGTAEYVVLAHLSEQNNDPEVAKHTAERALRERVGLLQNRLVLASQSAPLESILL
jgi:phosphoribosyl 1,2-cyclic phosphodiesterase